MDPYRDSPESFGQYLRRERELREISLDEISAYTRIKRRALEAIEFDDFATLPPLAFTRAFIRCYADYIGLNVPDVMLRFDTFIQSTYPELTGEVPIISKKKEPKQRYVPLALIILVILLSILYYWLSGSPPKPKSLEVETPLPRRTVEVSRGPLPPTTEVLERGLDGSDAGIETSTAREETDNGPAAPSQETDRQREEEPRTGPISNDRGSSPEIPSLSRDQGREDPEPKEAEEESSSIPWASDYNTSLGPPLELAVFRESKPETREDYFMPLRDHDLSIRHRVTITVDEPCWIQYFIDEDKSRVAILQPEQIITFEAVASARIKIGHPDGVAAVLYNDQPFDFRPQCSPWWLNFPQTPDDNVCP